MTEIKNDDVLQTIKDIISNSSLKMFPFELENLAFQKHKVYRQFSVETEYNEIFKNYLAKPVCEVLAYATGFNIKIVVGFNLEFFKSNIDTRSCVWSDLYLVLDSEENHRPDGDMINDEDVTRDVCCTIEVKPFPMIPYVSGPPQKSFEFFSMDHIPAYMKQAIFNWYIIG